MAVGLLQGTLCLSASEPPPHYHFFLFRIFAWLKTAFRRLVAKRESDTSETFTKPKIAPHTSPPGHRTRTQAHSSTAVSSTAVPSKDRKPASKETTSKSSRLGHVQERMLQRRQPIRYDRRSPIPKHRQLFLGCSFANPRLPTIEELCAGTLFFLQRNPLLNPRSLTIAELSASESVAVS